MSNTDKYISIPTNIPPKYLLNLKEYKIFQAGLNLFYALSVLSKIKKFLIRMSYLIFKSFYKFLPYSNNDYTITTLVDSLRTIISKDACFNMYVPVHGKVIAQVVNRFGHLYKFIKIAFSENAEMSIRQEIANLQMLKGLNLQNFVIPEILKYQSKQSIFSVELSCPFLAEPWEKSACDQ